MKEWITPSGRLESCGQSCWPPPCTQTPPWLECDNAIAVFRLPHALLRSRWTQADWFVSSAKLVNLASGHADRSTTASRADTAGKSFKLRLAPRLPPLTNAPQVHEWAPAKTSSDLAGPSDGSRLTSSLMQEKSKFADSSTWRAKTSAGWSMHGRCRQASSHSSSKRAGSSFAG